MVRSVARMDEAQGWKERIKNVPPASPLSAVIGNGRKNDGVMQSEIFQGITVYVPVEKRGRWLEWNRRMLC